MSQSISLEISDSLFERLRRQAQATQRPVEGLALEALSESIPRPPSELPTEVQVDLIQLESMDNAALKLVVGNSADEARATHSSYEATDRLALRKAYAVAILKWRGVPTDELQAIVSQ